MNYTQPEILKDEQQVTALLESRKDIRSIDAYQGAIQELFFIEHPTLKKEMPEAATLLAEFKAKNTLQPEWIYYPWSNTLVKSVPEETYFKLRTSRNRNILTTEEQERYRNVSVGVIGLSVGSQVVMALAQSGGPQKIKIADFDTVEITNLNRLRANLTDIGTNKTHVAAREVWELDPYAKLELWEKGVTAETIESFLIKGEKLDFFVDEMDDISLKILSRFIAREHGIPTIMATDNGDNVVLDVERFDLDKTLPIFHGLVGAISPEETRDLTFKQWLKLATQIVGPEFLPSSMKRSILQIGKTLPSVPQLGTTAGVAGAAISYVIRKLANKENIPSGRYIINFEEKLEPGYNTPEQEKKRSEELAAFMNTFGK